jgi:XTP/dITP diphosphohydrolase
LTVRIVLASANPDKAHEIRAIIGDAVVLEPRPAHVPDVVEDGATLVDNARLKAVALCAATGLPALADDTGLEVDALGGAPGVWAARYAGEHASYRDNVAKLLRELDGVGDTQRTARFRTVAMVRFPDGSELIGDGVVEGRIARDLRGENGFGYDPVFVPIEGDGRSFAEMNSDEKHAISHRGRALRALAAQLNASGLV